MTNKLTVEKYIEGFRESNHEKILSCLTDDIIWEMPGVYKHIGKVKFDKEIENENFVGSPTIQITRLIEENNISRSFASSSVIVATSQKCNFLLRISILEIYLIIHKSISATTFTRVTIFQL